MSFLSFLNKATTIIDKGIAIVKPFTPILANIPQFGPVFTLTFAAITNIEALLIGIENQGATKKSLVMQTVTAAQPSIDQSKLGDAIDKLLLGINALAALDVPLSAVQAQVAKP